jgi:probable phosphoglycerate mutase
MIPVAVIRHGPTDWNEQKRIQGRADRTLSPNGRERVATWSVPDEISGFDWVVSPLTRAVETAALLGLECSKEPLLIEMDWGAWEGQNRDQLVARYGDEFTQRTAKGIDLRPHGGESPREVRQRVRRWLDGVVENGRPAGAVCHQGVIRALMSLATGWDMINKPPYKLDWASAHLFTAFDDGRVEVDRLNLSLEAS